MVFCWFLFLIENRFLEILLIRWFLFPIYFLFPSFAPFKMSFWEWFLLNPDLLFEINFLFEFKSSFLFSFSLIPLLALFFSCLINFSSFLIFEFFFPSFFLSIGELFFSLNNRVLFSWILKFSFSFFFIFKFIFIGSDCISEEFKSSFVWLYVFIFKLVLVIILFFIICATYL